ncbi:MAG: ester cyclase [Bacteroidales bacterium]
MRKLFIVTVLLLFAGIAFSQSKADIEKNKKVATIYHELKAENVDDILTEDFIGRNEKSRHTWNREDHRNYLSNGNYKKDVILSQVAEGDWVATRFERTMDWNGERISVEAMQFKRFEDGKIAELWEYADTGQVETED